MKDNSLYPLFLKLDIVETLIVGAGNVGLEKVQFILKQSPNAKIKIVAKKFHPEIILKVKGNKNIQTIEREFIPQDLERIKVLIVATNNTNLNFEIYQLAQSKNILTNVVDNPALCDFYTAAVMKKGPIKIAVSSNGASPTLAKRLRNIFEEVIPDEVEDSAEMLEQIRKLLKGDLAEKIKTLNSLTTVLSSDYNCSNNLMRNEFYSKINMN
jgi:precorrin-2 dehydrogenase/sirohydrochlorin ferrochelatase